jgi:hypothetical protein
VFNDVWDFIKFLSYAFAICVIFFLVTWAAGCNSLALEWFGRGNQLMLDKAFSVQEENVRRETFEHSKAYIEGNIQELHNLQIQYAQADQDHRKALGGLILHRMADFPQDELPVDLRDFLSQLRREALTP